MDENSKGNLDVEFKRYLQIMRPYLAQLLDQDVIEICKAWIQRLSNANDQEKDLRNKYIFALCYQLARGVLDMPFLDFPKEQDLTPLSNEMESDTSSTEIEYIVMDSENDTKVVFNNKKTLASETDIETENNTDKVDRRVGNSNSDNEEKDPQIHKESVLCYTCPEVSNEYEPRKVSCEEYKCRANNLVLKLREIKTQNTLLHTELETLKKELKLKGDDTNENTAYANACTSGCCQTQENTSSLCLLKAKLQELENSREHLIQRVNHLQEALNNYDENKRRYIDEIEAKHKLEIIKIKSSVREDTKYIYEKQIEELKVHYKLMIENIENKISFEKQELINSKNRIISEKEQIINCKDNEIARLRNLNDDQKSNLQDVISKFLEKPSDDIKSDMRYKNEQLQKRLIKMEKSKTKCIKIFEAKLAHLQREKHLAECSLQLQVVRQRAQVVSEVADENQTELNTALNKLEGKYKEIVANMQATAIQRRVQDQMAIESILQAACGIRNEALVTNCSQGTNRSQFSSKTMQNQNRNGNQMNQSYDSEISALLNGNKVDNLAGGNKSLAGDSVMAGYCLDGERMGELFERVYIPQRDTGDGPLKE